MSPRRSVCVARLLRKGELKGGAYSISIVKSRAWVAQRSQVASVEGWQNSVVFLMDTLAQRVAREPLMLEMRDRVQIEA